MTKSKGVGRGGNHGLAGRPKGSFKTKTGTDVRTLAAQLPKLDTYFGFTRSSEGAGGAAAAAGSAAASCDVVGAQLAYSS